MHLLDKMAKIGLSHRILQQILDHLHQRFSVGRSMCGDYKTYTSFAVVQAFQGTFLW